MTPEEIWWATFTKPKAALLNEFAMSLDSDLFEPLHKHVKFQDFSREYFENSSVPSEWISEKTPRRGGKKSVKPKKFDNLLNSLADFLSAHAEKNVVILHTMTDLAGLYSSVPEKWHEFTLFLKGIQRASKKWGGLIYTDLATQVLPKRMEEEIAAIADGVLSFQWEQAGPVERRRTFHFRKFSGLLESHQEALTKFEVNISSSTGLFVVKPEAIEAIHR
jgi:hypothetical protein